MNCSPHNDLSGFAEQVMNSALLIYLIQQEPFVFVVSFLRSDRI